MDQAHATLIAGFPQRNGFDLSGVYELVEVGPGKVAVWAVPLDRQAHKLGSVCDGLIVAGFFSGAQGSANVVSRI